MSKTEDHSQSLKHVEEILKHEISQMKDYTEQAHEIQELIKGYKSKAEDSQKKLIEELEIINKERQRHQKTLKDFQQIHKKQFSKGVDYKNQYTQKKKQRVAISQKIDIKQLINLQIEDRKSESHELFKWIISVIYREPVGKYYWENFKQQAFKEDKGVDFKERMGKISALDLKEDEKVMTLKLINNRDKILNHSDFNGGVKQSIKNILEIARLIYQGTQIARKTKQLQTQDTKSRDQKIVKQQVFKKAEAKCLAMQERINIIQKYLNVLKDISKSISEKAHRYEQGAKQGNKITTEVKSLSSDNAKSTYLQIVKNNKEQCLLF